MTVVPTWTILVPTLGERQQLFERLMVGLLPQLERFDGRAQVVGWFNNGTPSLPEIRQRMIEATTTDYVSFVDDDDLVPPYFVAETMAALTQDPDYVGWLVQCYSDGNPTAIAHHSLKHREWRNGNGRHVRDISHINPMRTKVAQSADFRRTRKGAPEDRAWVDQIRRLGLLRTEVLIPRVMYHYLYSTSKIAGQGSRWRSPRLITGVARQVRIEHPYFSWSDRV